MRSRKSCGELSLNSFVHIAILFLDIACPPRQPLRKGLVFFSVIGVANSVDQCGIDKLIDSHQRSDEMNRQSVSCRKYGRGYVGRARESTIIPDQHFQRKVQTCEGFGVHD